MANILEEIDASVQSQLEADSDFQTSIANLPEEDKEQKIEEKKSELRNSTLEEMKSKAADADKFKSDYENQKTRAERAEAAAKGKTSTGDLSQTDILYVAKADIPEEDLSEVTDYAKLKGISVKSAHEFLMPVLADRLEKRQTAAATHTGRGGRGTSEETGADILAKAESTGEVPDTDEGMRKLFGARLDRKVSKHQRRK